MNKLDHIVNDITNEEVPQSRIDAAAARVRRNLFTTSRTAPERLRSCADFQALIPAYLAKSLSAGRSLLLQDHTRECVACRHALDEARAGNVRTLVRPQTPPTRTIPKWWAVAAMLAVAVGFGGFSIWRLLSPYSDHNTVEKVTGILYLVTDNASTPIFAGRDIPEGAKIRTAKDSKAYVRMADGTIVEMNERSELAFSHAMRAKNILLGRGDIIVQAAKQRNGTLNVLTADCTVSVKGTIFAVSRGVKGSRVAVVEGAVKVDQGSQSRTLKPGDQATTDSSLATASPKEAFAWSRDSARYLALLGEFSEIRKGLENMPGPGLRYNSRLLQYVPNDTVLYASIPNLGPAITEAERLFKQRLQESEVLRAWWNEQKDGPKVDEMIQRIKAFSDYLGDEVVLSISGNWEGEYAAPLILADVKKPGLDAFLNNEIRQLELKGATHGPKLVSLEPRAGDSDAFRGGSVKGSSMLYGVKNNVLAIGWSQAQMNHVAEHMADPRQSEPDRGLLGEVQKAYKRGASYLLCVNMEHIADHTPSAKKDRAERRASRTGFEDARYLIVERKDVAGRTENQATLAFAGRRSGMAGWLSSPAPMGSLDFISPNATFAVSAVLKSPQWMIGDLLRTLAADDPNFQEKLDKINKEAGIQISPSLGEPLGGEITFAFDGPVLPLPSWKLAVEVYSPDRLQWGIDQVIAAYNRNPKCPDCTINLAKEESGGRTFYTLSTNKFAYEIHYTFVDGYMLAAPSRTLLTQAIQNRQTGLVLSRSEGFRAQLPRDGNLNFSAIVYHNVGSALAPFAEQLGSFGNSKEQRDSISKLVANSKAGLIYAYGDEDAIRIATAGTFFGFDLETFALPSLIGKGMHSTKGALKQ